MAVVAVVLAVLSSSLGLCSAGWADEIVLSGVPAVKISEGGADRVVETLGAGEAADAECTITKVGDKYLWTSRNNVELSPIQGGAFLTFVATSGAGYVRMTLPSMRDTAASSTDETEKKFDYVEHMLIGLKSVTYYGRAK